MSGVGTYSRDVDVDLGRLFSSIGQNWRRIVLVSLVVTAAAFAIAWLATPHYKAETRILIETRESVFTRPDAREQGDRPILDEEGVTSQVEVITSTDLLKQVARDLDLAQYDEFEANGDPSPLSRLMILAGLKSDPGAIPPEERVLEAFRDKLEVYRVKDSRVIVIEFSSEDPELAAQVANRLAEAYVAVQQAAKLESNADATQWLGPEIADLRERVKEAEARVAEFRSRSDLLIGQNNSVLATQQLSELSSELSRVRANRAAAEAKAQAVRSALEGGASVEALPDVLASGLIQRLREREVQLRADIADLSTTLLSNHPRIRALNSQLADLDAQIRSEARKVLDGLETEAQTARFRERQLIQDLNRLKAESARADTEQVELRALEREAAAQRELLESYLTRFREASSRSDRNYLPADARIFSRAIAPSEPYFPKVLPITAAAFFVSLLVMAIATLLAELFSGRAMRPAYVGHSEPVFHEPDHAPHREAIRADEGTHEADSAHAAADHEAEERAGAREELVKAYEMLRAERLRLEEEARAAKEAAALPASDMDAGNAAVPAAAATTVAAAGAGRETEAAEPKKSEDGPGTSIWPKLERFSWPRRKPASPPPAPANEDVGAVAAMGTAPREEEADDETEAEERELDVAVAAERIIVTGADRAIFVSPEGDEAAASSVLVAREIADSGLRTVLVDLTSSGAASLPMLESKSYPGITNLLASEAQFTEIVHADLFSDCHVIPVGTANAARAMRAADRLPIILDSLNTAYDVVVIECGPVAPRAIERLLGDRSEILVSVLAADSEDVADTIARFEKSGYRGMMLVTPSGVLPPPGRSAA